MDTVTAPPWPGNGWLARVLLIAAALELVVVNFWPAFPSPSEWARVYQALAVVGRGSLDIGPEIRRFGAMEDVAASGERLYPNKAPGLLPLLLPGAAVARAVAGGDDRTELGLALFLGRLLASSLPFLISLLVLARLTVREERGGPLAVTAYALATPMLSASLLLFSHALTACLLLSAFALLHREAARSGQCLVAGALLGWAVTAELPVMVPAAVIAAAALPRLRLRRGALVAAGGVLPLALLGAYDAACFGSPWALSAVGGGVHPAYATLTGSGLFGIGWPGPESPWMLLLSPARGLLVWAPLLALAVLGAVRRPRQAEPIGIRVALAGAPLALLLLLSGYPNAHGGWFPGPRYLLPVVPLLAVLVARGVEPLLERGWGRVLVTTAALWGMAVTWLTLASFPYPPRDFPLPALTVSCRLLTIGVLARSWLPEVVLVPVLAVMAVAAAWELSRSARSGGRPLEALVAALMVAALLAAAATVPPPTSPTAALEWAVIRDLYTGGPSVGALEALRDRCRDPVERARVEHWIAVRDAGQGKRPR